MKVAALVPLAISLASASPVWNLAKRQSEVSSAVSSVVESASSAVESVASSAAAVPSSAASEASSAVASSAAPSASASAVPEYETLYPCPAGTELVYVEEQQNYPGVTLDQATPLLAFSAASWYGVVNATGDEVGATRNVEFPGVPVTIGEVLVNMTMTMGEDASIEQVFNGTTPVNAGGIQLASYSTVLQAYANDTTPSDLTAKIFTNACVQPRTVQDTLSQLFQAALTNLGTAVAGTAASGGASSAVESATSAAGAPVASASDAASAVTSAAASAASEAVESASSAIPSA